MSFSIVTDTAANLPKAILDQHQITAIPFTSYLKARNFHTSIRKLLKMNPIMLPSVTERPSPPRRSTPIATSNT